MRPRQHVPTITITMTFGGFMNTLQNSLKTLAAAAAVSLALAACGGGGGGGGSSGTGTGTTTTGETGGQKLLDAYAVPASIAADKVTGYTTPFSSFNTSVQPNCLQAGLTSTTVYVTPNAVVYATTTVSDKAQALAADLTEQGIANDKAFLGLSTSTVGYDGTRVNVCVDSALGQSIGETGTGVTGSGARDVFEVMSIDSPQFDTRYPGATSITGSGYANLYKHELTHVAHDALLGPIAGGALERWFAEGLAESAVNAPLPSKTTVLGYVDSADLITAAGSDDMTVYPAYQASVQYLLQNPGLGFGATNVPAFLAAFRARAEALCAQPIPAGVTYPASMTDGLPAGTYNACASATPGTVDDRVRALFDTTFNATFKNADGTPLLLHTADGANSFEATLHDRLAAWLP